MENRKQKFDSVDEYIRSFPENIQMKLEEMRAVIRPLVPEAQERISYQMPAFYQNGIIVWYAGFAKHIGFYPGADGIAAFKSELAGYKSAKGSVQFPLDKPLPAELISKMVRFRAAEINKKGRSSRTTHGASTADR